MYEVTEWSKEEISYGEQSSDCETEHLFVDGVTGHMVLWAPQNMMLQKYNAILNLKAVRVTLPVSMMSLIVTCGCKGSRERHISCWIWSRLKMWNDEGDTVGICEHSMNDEICEHFAQQTDICATDYKNITQQNEKQKLRQWLGAS